MSTTYYVATAGSDTTGNGNIAAPWATVEHALLTMSPGDTVYVRGGTYGGGMVLGAAHSGASGSPKVVRNYPGEDVIFEGSSSMGGHTLPGKVTDVSFYGDRNVRINDTTPTLRFHHPGPLMTIELMGTRLLIDGCDISHETSHPESCVSVGYNGSAGQFGSFDSDIMYCLIRDIDLDPTYEFEVGHDHGLYINYAVGGELAYNVIRSMGGGFGIHCYTETNLGRHVDGLWIHHNTIYTNRNGGIIVAGEHDTTKNCVIDNNLVAISGTNSYASTSVYSFMYEWGNPDAQANAEAEPNTGTGNHSYLPKNGDIKPGLTSAWILDTPTTGNPLFLNPDAGDFRLLGGSPAAGSGAFPLPLIDTTMLGLEQYTGQLGLAQPGGLVPKLTPVVQPAVGTNGAPIGIETLTGEHWGVVTRR